MYNLNWVCFSTTVNRVWQFSLTVDQDKGKAEKNALTTVMLLVFKIAVHTGFLGGKSGVYKWIR